MTRNKLFAETLKAMGFNLNRGYFSLTYSEIKKVDEVRRLFHYSGKNNMGREAAQQFWYAARRGDK